VGCHATEAGETGGRRRFRGYFVEKASMMERPTHILQKEAAMSASLGIKVLTLLGYVAVSTALVMLLADDVLSPGQSMFTVASLP
jgi:hypothetical protein